VQQHEYHAFEEKLQEVAHVFRGDLPVSHAIVKHWWRVAKPFDLATYRQACDDLIDSADFFPKPGELKRACEQYSSGPTDSTPGLRCLHVDYSRPPLSEDLSQRHWRCPAIFPFDGGRYYCPAHEALYKSSDRATEAEIDAAFEQALAAQPERNTLQAICANRARRRAEGATVIEASLKALLESLGRSIPEGLTSPEAIQARKAQMIADAKTHGLLP
jgi:hypothetical protein